MQMSSPRPEELVALLRRARRLRAEILALAVALIAANLASLMRILAPMPAARHQRMVAAWIVVLALSALGLVIGQRAARQTRRIKSRVADLVARE